MRKLALVLVTFLLSFNAKTQELELLLLAKNDANLLMQKYLNPVMSGMMYSLNNGWNHTAKTHKKLGFDISLNINASVVPESDKSFLFKPSDYQYLSLQSGSNTISTVMGSTNNSILSVRIPEANNFKIAQFSMPDGIGDDLPLNAVPSPIIQVSVGLPLSTDISVRYLPNINTSDVETNFVGFGLKHNLMQYVGVLDKLPLNLAVFGGFTTMDVTYNMQNVTGLPGSNQSASIELNSYTIQAFASLDFPVISVYGGLGYDKGSSSLKINGSYSLSYTIEGTGTTVTETVTNPINLAFDETGMRGTLGARLNLAFFKLYGDFTMKKYNTITAGIAFSFR